MKYLNSLIQIVLNATYNDPDVEVVDVDNGVPSIILLSSMIEKGSVTKK